MMVKIVQHCFGQPASGGPVVAMERLILNSPLKYIVMRQLDAAGGINLFLLLRFVIFLRRERPALIHVRGLGNEGFHAALAAKLAGVPNILVSVHGTHRDLHFSGNLLRHWVVVNVLEDLTLKMSTHIATVCEYAASRSFLQPYSSKLISVVPNGVDFPPNVKNCGCIRSEFNIPSSVPLAVTVSRVTKEKGYLVLAEALQILDLEGLTFALIIVGGGDEGGYIRGLFDRLVNIDVRFAGHRNDVSGFLAESDFFVFPTLHENLSNALLEAMSFGLPVVATDTGGNTEVLRRGGGVLVPVGDPLSLARGMQKLIESTEIRNKLGDEASDIVCNHYSVQHMVKNWLKVYQDILGRSIDAD